MITQSGFVTGPNNGRAITLTARAENEIEERFLYLCWTAILESRFKHLVVSDKPSGVTSMEELTLYLPKPLFQEEKWKKLIEELEQVEL